MLNTEVCLYLVRANSAKTTKAAWIVRRTHGDQGDQGAVHLQHCLQAQGLVVNHVSYATLDAKRIKNYQIFLLEVEDGVDAILLQTIVELRIQTLALLVVLMAKPTSADVIQILGAGADAVWTSGESSRVLCARARALLRRLKPLIPPEVDCPQ